MTGLYGVFGNNDITEAELSEMSRRLIHRGLYSHYERLSSGIIFGCNKQQQIHGVFINNNYAIVADANIYNFDELSHYLATSLGYALTTDRPEELLAALYFHGGINGIARVNGDFAFVLWDDEKQELILGRDFLGCRPLYYNFLPCGGLVFASEYKALLAIEAMHPIPDLDMIQHLQYCKKLPLGKTLLKNVSAVIPGSLIVVNSNGNQLRQEFLPKLTLNIKYANEQESLRSLKDNLYQAIACRVDNPNKVGIALSGGIDSIGVVCIMRQLYPKADIHTFTAGYGKDDPEIIRAAKVADKMKTIHHEIITTPALLKESLPNLVWSLEDPYSRSESLQLYEVARVASKYVKVLMSAQAADGLFAGMPKSKLLWLMKQAHFIKRPLEDFYNLTQVGIKPKNLTGKIANILYYKNKLPDVPKIIGTKYVPEAILFPSCSQEFINEMLVSGFQAGASQDLHKFESTFAASSLSYCSPFHDLRLIKTAFSISDAFKIRKGKQKYILRQALKSIVPEECVNIPKFPQRMKYDLSFSNILDEVSAQILSLENVESRGFFKFSEIQNLKKRKADKPYSGEGAMRIWTALLTEIWAMEFIDKRGSGPVML